VAIPSLSSSPNAADILSPDAAGTPDTAGIIDDVGTAAVLAEAAAPIK
jgi:hypothetical protein